MTDENVTAQELCKIASQYEVSSDEIIRRVVSEASTAACSGRKYADVPFNSKATSEAEFEKAKTELEQRGFSLTSKRNDEWLRVEITFDVCD